MHDNFGYNNLESYVKNDFLLVETIHNKGKLNS